MDISVTGPTTAPAHRLSATSTASSSTSRPASRATNGDVKTRSPLGNPLGGAKLSTGGKKGGKTSSSAPQYTTTPVRKGSKNNNRTSAAAVLLATSLQTDTGSDLSPTQDGEHDESGDLLLSSLSSSVTSSGLGLGSTQPRQPSSLTPSGERQTNNNNIGNHRPSTTTATTLAPSYRTHTVGGGGGGATSTSAGSSGGGGGIGIRRQSLSGFTALSTSRADLDDDHDPSIILGGGAANGGFGLIHDNSKSQRANANGFSFSVAAADTPSLFSGSSVMGGNSGGNSGGGGATLPQQQILTAAGYAITAAAASAGSVADENLVIVTAILTRLFHNLSLLSLRLLHNNGIELTDEETQAVLEGHEKNAQKLKIFSDALRQVQDLLVQRKKQTTAAAQQHVAQQFGMSLQKIQTGMMVAQLQQQALAAGGGHHHQHMHASVNAGGVGDGAHSSLQGTASAVLAAVSIGRGGGTPASAGGTGGALGSAQSYRGPNAVTTPGSPSGLLATSGEFSLAASFDAGTVRTPTSRALAAASPTAAVVASAAGSAGPPLYTSADLDQVLLPDLLRIHMDSLFKHALEGLILRLDAQDAYKETRLAPRRTLDKAVAYQRAQLEAAGAKAATTTQTVAELRAQIESLQHSLETRDGVHREQLNGFLREVCILKEQLYRSYRDKDYVGKPVDLMATIEDADTGEDVSVDQLFHYRRLMKTAEKQLSDAQTRVRKLEEELSTKDQAVARVLDRQKTQDASLATAKKELDQMNHMVLAQREEIRALKADNARLRGELPPTETLDAECQATQEEDEVRQLSLGHPEAVRCKGMSKIEVLGRFDETLAQMKDLRDRIDAANRHVATLRSTIEAELGNRIRTAEAERNEAVRSRDETLLRANDAMDRAARADELMGEVRQEAALAVDALVDELEKAHEAIHVLRLKAVAVGRAHMALVAKHEALRSVAGLRGYKERANAVHYERAEVAVRQAQADVIEARQAAAVEIEAAAARIATLDQQVADAQRQLAEQAEAHHQELQHVQSRVGAIEGASRVLLADYERLRAEHLRSMADAVEHAAHPSGDPSRPPSRGGRLGSASVKRAAPLPPATPSGRPGSASAVSATPAPLLPPQQPRLHALVDRLAQRAASRAVARVEVASRDIKPMPAAVNKQPQRAAVPSISDDALVVLNADPYRLKAGMPEPVAVAASTLALSRQAEDLVLGLLDLLQASGGVQELGTHQQQPAVGSGGSESAVFGGTALETLYERWLATGNHSAADTQGESSTTVADAAIATNATAAGAQLPAQDGPTAATATTPELRMLRASAWSRFRRLLPVLQAITETQEKIQSIAKQCPALALSSPS